MLEWNLWPNLRLRSVERVMQAIDKPTLQKALISPGSKQTRTTYEVKWNLWNWVEGYVEIQATYGA